MGLSLLAPAALALGVLASLPVLAHLSRQTPRERQAFGAMLLVRRLVKRLRSRRRLRDLPLLSLRLLLVLALALVAAGAEWRWISDDPQSSNLPRVVLVIDTSMSMGLVHQGSSLVEQAKAGALAHLGTLRPGTEVGLVRYGGEVVRLTPELTKDHAIVAAMIGEIREARGGGDLKSALQETRRLLAGKPGEVAVFSDEAGPNMIPDALGELGSLVAAGSAINPFVLGPEQPANLAVMGARYGDGPEGGQVAVRLMNFGAAAAEVTCEVSLPDGAKIPIFVDLPPEGEAEQRVTVPREAGGGVGNVRCDDRELAGDDTWYFHLPHVGASRVLLVGGSPGDTPTASEVYFLERAISPWGGARGSLRAEVVPVAGLLGLDPEVYRVAFLANVADPRPYAASLVEFVRKGGGLVITGGDNVSVDRYNEALAALLPAPLRKARALSDGGEAGVPLLLPDLTHPLFEPFSRGGRGGFARVKLRRALTYEPYTDQGEVQTLLRLEGGLPALTVRRVGAGHVLVWSGTLDFDWGNLPVQSVYLPLMQRIVSWLGGESGVVAGHFDGLVGEQVVIPVRDPAVVPDVEAPDGARVATRLEGGELVFRPDRPGTWLLRVDEGAPLGRVAVNLRSDESDVRRLHSIRKAEQALAPERYQRVIDLSPWFTALAFVMALAQALMGRGVQSDG